MNRFASWAIACIVLTAFLMLTHVTWADDVTDNAVIAHKKLVRLHSAVLTYLNDSDEKLDDPLHLYPTIVNDPLLFWHPGDTNSAPQAINNSLPNAANSAQISFLFRTGNLGSLMPHDYLIWDASPDNNQGRFVSLITYEGMVETIPPLQVPVPTRSVIAQHRLANIGTTLRIYLNDSAGFLPQDLGMLYPDFITTTRAFWNPGDSDPVPTDITNSVPNALNSANVSFDYPAAGLHEIALAPDTILVQDNTPDNNAGLGRLIYRYDGSIRFELVGMTGDANNDERLDLADWARLQRCFQEWNYFDLLEDDACRVFDFNDDTRVTSADHALFLDAMTGPGVR